MKATKQYTYKSPSLASMELNTVAARREPGRGYQVIITPNTSIALEIFDPYPCMSDTSTFRIGDEVHYAVTGGDRPGDQLEYWFGRIVSIGKSRIKVATSPDSKSVKHLCPYAFFNYNAGLDRRIVRLQELGIALVRPFHNI